MNMSVEMLSAERQGCPLGDESDVYTQTSHGP
jgi:hypothetical protein